MLAFYLLEFLSGYLIRLAVGVSPWNYEEFYLKIGERKFNSHYKGLICLEFAPIWYIYGIKGEYYFRYLMRL